MPAANRRGATMDTVQAHRPDSDAEVAESVLPTTDFVDCYRTHYRRLIRALQLSGTTSATAEDIAQEAFARALVHWRRIRRGSNPPGYVYTTGFRLLQRAQRRAAPLAAAPTTPVALPTPPPASQADPTGSAATTVVALEGALAAMPPRRRASRGHVPDRRDPRGGRSEDAGNRSWNGAQAHRGGSPRFAGGLRSALLATALSGRPLGDRPNATDEPVCPAGQVGAAHLVGSPAASNGRNRSACPGVGRNREMSRRGSRPRRCAMSRRPPGAWLSVRGLAVCPGPGCPPGAWLPGPACPPGACLPGAWLPARGLPVCPGPGPGRRSSRRVSLRLPLEARPGASYHVIRSGEGDRHPGPIWRVRRAKLPGAPVRP